MSLHFRAPPVGTVASRLTDISGRVWQIVQEVCPENKP